MYIMVTCSVAAHIIKSSVDIYEDCLRELFINAEIFLLGNTIAGIIDNTKFAKTSLVSFHFCKNYNIGENYSSQK